MELRIDRLTKQYGAKIAVDRMDFTLKAGVYGLLGANGAGKTTLMRMICDILRPTSGEVLYDGGPSRNRGTPTGWFSAICPSSSAITRNLRQINS